MESSGYISAGVLGMIAGARSAASAVVFDNAIANKSHATPAWQTKDLLDPVIVEKFMG
jgi:hypothetical protein